MKKLIFFILLLSSSLPVSAAGLCGCSEFDDHVNLGGGRAIILNTGSNNAYHIFDGTNGGKFSQKTMRFMMAKPADTKQAGYWFTNDFNDNLLNIDARTGWMWLKNNARLIFNDGSGDAYHIEDTNGAGGFSTKAMRFSVAKPPGANTIGFLFSNDFNDRLMEIDGATGNMRVLGTVTTASVVVQSGLADYVFEPGYKLMPLDRLEQEIQELGHLPGMPSAQEASRNGVDVGEMQKKLLEKTEELTLHLIDLKKENAALRERVSVLERK